MKTAVILETVLFALAIIIALIQLWFTPWIFALFIKLEITIGAVFVLVLVVWFVARELDEDEETRSGERLDD